MKIELTNREADIVFWSLYENMEKTLNEDQEIGANTEKERLYLLDEMSIARQFATSEQEKEYVAKLVDKINVYFDN